MEASFEMQRTYGYLLWVVSRRCRIWTPREEIVPLHDANFEAPIGWETLTPRLSEGLAVEGARYGIVMPLSDNGYKVRRCASNLVARAVRTLLDVPD